MDGVKQGGREGTEGGRRGAAAMEGKGGRLEKSLIDSGAGVGERREERRTGGRSVPPQSYQGMISRWECGERRNGGDSWRDGGDKAEI